MVTVKNRAAADAVTALVDALTDESSAEDVIAAKSAYDALTDAQKPYVTEETVNKLNAQVTRVEEAVITAKAAEFKAKVDALGETPTFPLCKPEVESLVAEYETLDEKVKARLADTKSTLDTYAAVAARYELLTATFRSDSIASTFSGYDSYFLVIYNPTDADVSFYYAGDASGWAAVGATTLKPGYNQIAYDIRFAQQGNAYVYGDKKSIDFTGASEAWTGWVCKVYGYTADSSETPTVRVALSVGGTTDDPTYGKVLINDTSAGYMSNWGYMTAAQFEALSAYEDVHFYVYNPSDVDVYFFFQDDKNWAGLDRTLCKAGEWTKITLSQVLNLPEGANGAYVDVEKGTEGIVFEGWMITDFYGTK